MSPLWSGRYDTNPSEALWAFTVDLDTDAELWPQDVAVSRAHARMLGSVGLMDSDELEAVLEALDRIETEFSNETFQFAPDDEDIHTAIERRLTEIAGEAGARIHAGRSRNDLVATDFRLWCRDAADRLVVDVDSLATALLDQAESAGDALAPGYTHLQRAQPVTLGHALVAHVAHFDRDAGRLKDARARMSESPLGAGALATTTLPIDPELTARTLGFESAFSNSIDAVSARDFAAELLGAVVIASTHLSRLAAEIVLWATEEFGVIELDDAWTTGSSMMPQKRNPDVAELSRAVSGRTIGAFVSLMTVLKGLPLSYKRDLQEDKAPTFQAIERFDLALVAMRGLISTAKFDLERLELAASGGNVAATDIAERLVLADVPFRRAHQLVAGLVRDLSDQGRSLIDVTSEELYEVHESLGECAGEWMSPRSCVDRRKLAGGPNPEAVSDAIEHYRKRIASRSMP